MACKNKEHPIFLKQDGNIFFALFGAIALVGVLGTITISVMRGPLSTMVEVQTRTQAESEMAIASRLALLEATELSANGDCDGDGFVEPLEYQDAAGAGPTGGGFLPNAVASSRIDPWGTEYGYCAWDAGGVTNNIACDTDTSGTNERLDGNASPTDETYSVIAIISAGPDQTFNSTCTGGATPSITKAGDDIITEFTYASATAETGGLWNLKSGDPTTAEITKNLEVDGSASFSGGIDLTGSSSALELGAASLLFPTEGTLINCNAANHGLIRVNTSLTPDGLELCDSSVGWIQLGGGLWEEGTGDDIYYDDGTAQVGIGNNSPSEALDVTGNIAASGNITAGSDITATGNVSGADLSASGNATITGTLGVTGTSNLGTLNASGAVDFDSSLNVDGATTLVGTLDAQGNISDSTGDLTISDNLVVTGTSDLQGDITNSTGNVTIDTDSEILGSLDVVDVSVSNDLTVDGTVSNPSGNLAITDDVDVTGAIDATGDIDGSDITASGDVNAGNIINVNGDQLGPAMNCSSTQKLEWNNGSGWSCVTDLQGGAGGGTPALDDLTDVAAATPTDGECLVYNNTSGDWENAPCSGTGAGIFEIVSNVARVKSTAGDYTNDDFVFGSPQLDDDGDTNHDSRFFFDKSQSAFRAGLERGNGWNSTNLGQYSTAFGRDPTASGNYSFAVGETPNATGRTSVVMGAFNTASGDFSVAVGRDLTASGEGAMSLVKDVDTTGDYSMGIGLGITAGTDPIVSGNNSLGIFMGDQSGIDVTANNTMSVMGGTVAIGDIVATTGGMQNLELDVTGDIGADNYCDADGNNCTAATDLGGGLWTDLTGGRIHYGTSSANQVGVGTANPQTTLDVNGGLRVGSVSGGAAPTFMNLNDLGDVSASSPTSGDCIVYNNGTGNWESGSCATGSNLGIFEVASNVVRMKSTAGDYTNDDFVFGSPQLDDDSDANHDARMLFDKSKGAFRAGQVDGTQWDNANIGDESVAFGLNNTASGTRSFVTGFNSIASGTYSIALGNNLNSTGQNSMAWGNYVNATGQYSTAGGATTVASGIGSFAIGEDTIASGDQSFAFGLGDATGTGVNRPTVSGVSSFGIFMGDQTGLDLSDANTMSLMGGELGIGTLSPSEILQVEGSALFRDCTYINRRDATDQCVGSHYTFATKGLWENQILHTSGGDGNASQVILAEGAPSTHRATFGFNSTTNIAYVEADAADLVLLPANNVGIGSNFHDGTDTVESMLHIQSGDIRLDGGEGNEAGCIRYNDTSDELEFSDDCSTFTAISSAGSASGVFEVTGGAGSEVARAVNANVPYTTSDFVFGSPQLDDDGDANHRARIFYDKSKAAFRAGATNGTEWDDANVGTNSVALGAANTASGGNSTALGIANVASGDNSTVLGVFSRAGGGNSSAIGIVAIADGDDSVALGREATATGANSFAFGLGTPTGADPIVSGDSSFGIFMGDQSGVDITANNVMSVMGGNVGIGTVSPATLLHVNGVTRLTDINASSNDLEFYAAGRRGYIDSWGGSGALGSIEVGTYSISSVNKYMYLHGDNGFGFGTRSPRSSFDIVATDAVILPSGTTAQRPGTGVNGMIRYNSTTNEFEGYENGAWTDLVSSGSSLWTDNTTHISREDVHILNSGTTMTAAGFDGVSVDGVIAHTDKRALRTGNSDNGAWNEANIGSRSFGAGKNPWATASDSVAMGWESRATAGVAIAMGSQAYATGENSLSFGRKSTASGRRALAIGLGDATGTAPVVSGDDSLGIFMGDQSGVDVTGNNIMSIMGGEVGIGTVSPDETLTINASDADFSQYSYGNTPQHIFYRANGTEASPSGVSDGDYIGLIDFYGHQSGTGYNNAAYMGAVADGNADVGQVPMALVFGVAYNFGAGKLAQEKLRIDKNGRFGFKDRGADAQYEFSLDGSTALPFFMISTDDDNDGDVLYIGSNSDASFGGTGGLRIHSGTTAQRPGSPDNGTIRYNSTTNKFEGYENSAWTDLAGGSSLWTDNTTHITRGNTHILNAGETMITAGFDGTTPTGMIYYTDQQALRMGIGSFSRWDEANIGNRSFAVGSAEASGSHSVGMGQSINATGNFSFAAGDGSQAGGTYAVAMGGGGTTADGVGSFATGYNNTASGSRAIAMGNDTTSSGDYSMALGLGDATGTAPIVSGNSSLGIFMGDQSGLDLTDANTMAIMGATDGVGIGTLAPQLRLHVHNSSTGSFTESGIAITTGDTGATGNDGIALGYYNNAGDEYGYLWMSENEEIKIGTNGLERARITGGGSIGIGDFNSDTVDSILHLASGDIRIDGGAGNEAGCIRFNDTTDQIEFSDDCSNFLPINAAGAQEIDSLGDARTDYADENFYVAQGAGGTNGTITNYEKNMGIGIDALTNMGTGCASESNWECEENTAIGIRSMTNATTAWNNTAIGYQSLRDVVGGYSNVAIGHSALRGITTGYNNVAVGNQALRDYGAAGGSGGNIAIGSDSLKVLDDGFDNTAIGDQSLEALDGDQDSNTALGNDTGVVLASGNRNTFLGDKAGEVITSGNNNLFIGQQAADTQTAGSDNIAIGQNVQLPNTTGDDQLNIGNLIYGDLANNYAGVNVGAPLAAFHIDYAGGTGTTDPAILRLNNTTSQGSAKFQMLEDGDSAINQGFEFEYFSASDGSDNYLSVKAYPNNATPDEIIRIERDGSQTVDFRRGSVDVTTGASPTLNIASRDNGDVATLGLFEDYDDTNPDGAELRYDGVNNFFDIGTGANGAHTSRFGIDRDSGNVGIGDFSGGGDTIDSSLHIASGELRLDGGVGNEAGCIRFNDTTDQIEYSNDCSAYSTFGGGSGVFEVSSNVVRGISGTVAYATDDFVFGSSQLADTGDANHDSRMFFDKSKGAFRAGTVTGAQWDDTNVGTNSAAFGGGYATNNYSFAHGQAAWATGAHSIGLGSNSRARGDYSVAIGFSANTQSAASDAVALGKDVNITGANAFAFGLGTSTGTDPVVSGNSSFGIFMGDQNGVDLSDANTVSIMGASGGVGIGTVSPNADGMHIDTGGVLIRGTDGANAARFLVDTSSGNTEMTLYSGAQVDTVKIDSVGTSHFTGGNVGIGTDTPAYTLDVDGDINIASGQTYRLGGEEYIHRFLHPGNNITQTFGTQQDHSSLDTTSYGANLFVGFEAGERTTTGITNTFVGNAAGRFNTTGGGNTTLGYNAGIQNRTGSSNVMIGQDAGAGSFAASDVSRNVMVGREAGAAILTGADDNVFIGYQTGDATTTGSDNILIGSSVEATSATASNELNIGNSIYGDLANDLIGIGQVPATGVELDVLGDIEYTGTITDVSDRRLKENIAPLSKHGALINKLQKIDTYSFTMKDDEDGKTEFGVMAQELEQIFPELVRTADDEMGTKSVNYVGLIAPMIEATKELKTENNALKHELTELKTAQAQTNATLTELSEQIALLNKVTSQNIGNKASMVSYIMLLLGLIGGGMFMMLIHRRKAHNG